MALPRRRLLIGAAAVVAVFTIALLVALPEIVRAVAVSRMTQLTGRAVTLADVDLNLFTGRMALKSFRLAQRGSTDPALEFDRLDVRFAITSIVSGHLRVRELLLTAPQIFVTRLSPGHFDFDDLLALLPPPDPTRPPSTTTVTVDRLTIARGVLLLRDAGVTPERSWRVDELTVDGTGVTSRPGATPGSAKVTAKINGRRIALAVDSVDLVQTALVARVSIHEFELARAAPYAPPTVPVLPTDGRLTAELKLSAARTPEALKISLAGDIRLDGLALARRDADAPLLRLGRLSVGIREITPLTGTVTVSAVEIDGLDLTAVRDRHGQIDLLSLARPAEPAPAAPPAAPAPAASPPAPPLQILVERIAVTNTRAALRDETVTPAATLALRDVTITVTSLTWPNTMPLGIEVALGLPGAGRVTTKGTARLTPLSVDVTTSLRDGSIEPYHPYLPFRARLAGRFNGDSRTQVTADGGRVTATSTGRSWIDAFEVRDPADGSVPIRLERFEIAGIDFAWPTHARAATITARRPNVRIERSASGDLRLRDLFEVGPSDSAPVPKAESAPSASPAPRKDEPPVPAETRAAGGAIGFPVAFGAVVIDDGYVQFLDRTVQPAFSETLSRLAVRVEGLSTTPGQRAKLTAQAIVGGDAALEMHGELAPLGELYADISGELRDFTLARANPYADSLIAWVVDRGKLGVRFHYKIERDQLDASNEIVVENIHVTPSRQDDEVKKKIGLPLGLIVALVTDGDNGLRVNLPMSGPLASWRADLGDAIWTVVKNVAVNIIASPFRAIGRLFKGKDDRVEELRVEPVVFAPGAADVPEAMQRHLTAVADFLRRAPAIRLTLSAVAGGADLEALKGQELTARLQARQREGGLPDFAAAVTAEFKERFPGVALPKPDEQLARLRAEEPAPTAHLPELLERRVSAVREGLVKTQGVPEARLGVDATGATPADGEGRVEFRIGQ